MNKLKDMFTKIKSKLKNFILKNVEDLFIGIGLLFIIATTFYLSPIVALYMTGTVFIAIGIILARINSRNGGERID